ncbi:MAG: hypothetical protein RJA76_539 [Bacteroidota bacterium]
MKSRFFLIFILFCLVINLLGATKNNFCRYEDGNYECKILISSFNMPSQKRSMNAIVQIQGCQLLRLIACDDSRLLEKKFYPIEIDDSGIVEWKTKENLCLFQIGKELPYRDEK